MNDARVEHIEETLANLGQKVDGLAAQLTDSTNRLDGRIDNLAAVMKDGFDQVQAGFEDHRRYEEFLSRGVRDDMSQRFNHVERRFDRMDARFDRMDERFDRLESLIKER